MIELLPCPFCGGAANVGWDGGRADHFTVQCDECIAQVAHQLTEAEAIAAWNRRPEPAAAEAGPVAFETWEAEALRARVEKLEEWVAALDTRLKIHAGRIDLEARLEELEEHTQSHKAVIVIANDRLALLEQVAGYGQRAERGEGMMPDATIREYIYGSPPFPKSKGERTADLGDPEGG